VTDLSSWIGVGLLIAVPTIVVAATWHAFRRPDFTEKQYERSKPIMVIRSAEASRYMGGKQPTAEDVERDIEHLLRKARRP